MFFKRVLKGLTIDSLIPEGAPPRIVNGEEVPNLADYYSKHYNAHYRSANVRVRNPPPTKYMQTLLKDEL